MSAEDQSKFHISLYPEINNKGDLLTPEEYTCENPKVTVGNLIIGELYVEPVGTVEIVCHDTGEKSELEYKARGWTSRYKNELNCIIKDSDGKARYQITGKYTE